MSEFKLRGHSRVYGGYPGPVIAVGEMEELGFVAIYPGGKSGPTPEPIEEDAGWVHHTERTAIALESFDWRNERLMEFSEQEVERYAADQEREYLAELLTRKDFETADPFVRLMLAKQTRRHELILPEIQACYEVLVATDWKAAGEWREKEKQELPQKAFVASSFAMAGSPLMMLVYAAIFGVEGMVPVSVEWGPDGTRDVSRVEPDIRHAAIFIEICGHNGDGPTDAYERGAATALKKPTLLLTTDAAQAHYDEQRDFVIQYDSTEILDAERQEELKAKIVAAITELEIRASEAPDPIVMTDEFMDFALKAHQFARDLQKKGEFLVQRLGEILKTARQEASASGGLTVEAQWKEYENAHETELKPDLSGGTTRTHNSLTELIEDANGSRRMLRGLEGELQRLRSAMESCGDAYGTAKERIGNGATQNATEQVSVLVPLQGWVQNVTKGAARFDDGLMRVMLPSPARKQKADQTAYA